MFKWVSVTFNVQTLRREERLVKICRALRSAHFIGPQSTSDRTEPEEDSPVYTTRADKFRVYRFPYRICERNNSVRRFGSVRIGFWTRHRRASYPCFCWMPTVTSSKILGESRSVSTAAKKPHATASVWENSCGTTICKRRTHTSQWERLSLDPSLILRSTSRVFWLLFMFTDVVHCTTTKIECN